MVKFKMPPTSIEPTSSDMCCCHAIMHGVILCRLLSSFSKENVSVLSNFGLLNLPVISCEQDNFQTTFLPPDGMMFENLGTQSPKKFYVLLSFVEGTWPNLLTKDR